MSPENYKKHKTESKSNYELFYRYYLEEKGKEIPYQVFHKYLQTWFIFQNRGDIRGAEIKLVKWLDDKHKN